MNKVRCQAYINLGYSYAQCERNASSEETIYQRSDFTEPRTISVCGTHRNVIHSGKGINTREGYHFSKRSQEQERAARLEQLNNNVWYALKSHQYAVDHLGGVDVVQALYQVLPVIAKSSDASDNPRVAWGLNLLCERFANIEKLKDSVTAAERERDAFIAKEE